MIGDPSRLSHELGRLSSLTAQYASDFLLGNDFSFAQVAKLRERESDAYVLEGSLRTARARSETAWAKRDYQSIIDAIEPLEQRLSPAEKKRLEYARQQH